MIINIFLLFYLLFILTNVNFAFILKPTFSFRKYFHEISAYVKPNIEKETNFPICFAHFKSISSRKLYLWYLAEDLSTDLIAGQENYLLLRFTFLCDKNYINNMLLWLLLITMLLITSNNIYDLFIRFIVKY